jgi:hypothetical protein
MAVFVCAADESSDQNPRQNFFYGGFAAPLTVWEGVFADAWNERVLNGPPQIPFLHTTSILSPAWRAKYGLTERDASVRLDEAARIIRITGALIPVMVYVDQGDFDAILRQPFLPRGRKRPVSLDPDYICFICFVLTQLMWINDREDDVERVDFWVEENGQITRFLHQFHAGSRDAVLDTGSPHLAPLVGEFNQVGKDRIPVQAADVLAWHARNAERNTLDRDGWRRYSRMVDWGQRYGYKGPIKRDLLEKLAAGFARRLADANASDPSCAV